MIPVIVIAAIGIIIGWDSGRRGFASTPAAKAQASRKSWLVPSIKAYLILFISILMETGIAILFRMLLGTIDIYFFKLVSMVVDNGVGIIICWPLVFYLYDKKVREAGIDNQEEYSKTASKICASLLVWIVCIILLIRLRNEFDASNSNSVFLFNRIIMWMIAPLGGFVEFRENKNIQNKKETVKEKRHSIIVFLRKNSPIIIGLVCVFMVIFFSFWYQDVALVAMQYFMLWLVVYAISFFSVKAILSPSLDSSKKRFIRKSRRKRNKGRFGWMNYCFIDNRLFIKAVNVENPNKDRKEEFSQWFGEIVKEDCDEEEALKTLEERFIGQHKYMESAVL